MEKCPEQISSWPSSYRGTELAVKPSMELGHLGERPNVTYEASDSLMRRCMPRAPVLSMLRCPRAQWFKCGSSSLEKPMVRIWLTAKVKSELTQGEARTVVLLHASVKEMLFLPTGVVWEKHSGGVELPPPPFSSGRILVYTGDASWQSGEDLI